MWQCSVVDLGGIAVLGECFRDGVNRGVVLPVAVRDAPFHYGADALTHFAGRLSLRVPNRDEDGYDIGSRNCVDGLLAKVR